jgi:hypothetical protein
MENSPLSVKGCKIQTYARNSGPLSREGSLSCHTCCETGPQFLRSHPKVSPIQSPLTTHKGMWRIYSNPDPFGFGLPRSSFTNKYDFLICKTNTIPILMYQIRISTNQVRIRVRIGPPYPQACRKRRLNGAVLRMRPENPRSRVTTSAAR